MCIFLLLAKSALLSTFSQLDKKKNTTLVLGFHSVLGLNQVFISRFFWILTADVVLFFPVQKRRIFRHPLLLRAYKREWERERERERERLSIVTSRRKRHREINYTYGKKESSFRLQRKSEREKKRDPKFIHSFIHCEINWGVLDIKHNRLLRCE